MEKSEAKSWLEGDQEYYSGLAIFMKYGKSAALKNLLSKKGPSPYNQGKLEYELGKISKEIPSIPVKVIKPVRIKLAQPPAIEQPAPSTISLPPVYSDIELPSVDFESLPDQLKHETIQRVKLFKKTWILHFTLSDKQSDEERKGIAKTIIQNMDEVNRLWSRIDYYLKHGTIPVDEIQSKKDEGPLDLLGWAQKQLNLRTYVSRAKTKLKTLKDPIKILKTEEDIAKWDLELISIAKQLSK